MVIHKFTKDSEFKVLSLMPGRENWKDGDLRIQSLKGYWENWKVGDLF